MGEPTDTSAIPEDEFIDCKCPYCHADASFSTDFCGRIQECPNCLQTIIVPDCETHRIAADAPNEAETANEQNYHQVQQDVALVGTPVPIPIITSRLVLRRFHIEDQDNLVEIASHAPYFMWVRGDNIDANLKRWLKEDFTKNLATPNSAMCLGIELKGASKLIGYATIYARNPEYSQGGVQDSFIIPPHRNQGYATEAFHAILAFCFDSIHLHRVSAACESRNIAACRLMEKLGMRREGEFVEDTWADGAWQNTAYYALLQSEYSAVRDSTPPVRPTAPQ